MMVLQATLLTAFSAAGWFFFSEPEAPPTAYADAKSITREIAKADPGETVRIPAGRYDIVDLKLRRDIELIGEGEVIFAPSRDTEKGILNPLPGVSLRVENITFQGARSPDLNGAGIRHDGHNLIVVNCRFDKNENGILSTGDEDGEIYIEKSVFTENGHGDGYSHGMYIVRAKSLTVVDSKIIGTRIGHHIKSLADITFIQNNELNDADGGTSYAVDVSRGGDVTIDNNRMTQTQKSENAVMINYDLSRGGDATALKITNNEIENTRKKGFLLRNNTPLTPVIEGNNIQNAKGARWSESP